MRGWVQRRARVHLVILSKGEAGRRMVDATTASRSSSHAFGTPGRPARGRARVAGAAAFGDCAGCRGLRTVVAGGCGVLHALITAGPAVAGRRLTPARACGVPACPCFRSHGCRGHRAHRRVAVVEDQVVHAPRGRAERVEGILGRPGQVCASRRGHLQERHLPSSTSRHEARSADGCPMRIT